MKKILLGISIVLLLNLFVMAETIDKIVLKGNKKVSRDTVFFYMKSREKGVYSKAVLREDFKSLWKTGFFENIGIESEDGTNGKIISITVIENKLISNITYKTGNKIKENDIVDKLQENNIVLTAFSYFNPARIKKIERIIKDMLIEKGYSQGKVAVTSKEDKGQVALNITVVQGPKTRIGAIEFPGIEGQPVSASFLQGGMKNNKVHNLMAILGSKDVYSKEKISEDLEAIKLKLQQKGYLEAKVGTPTLSMFKHRTVFGKTQNMMKLSIPVEVGPRYRMGTLKIEGNKIIKTDFLRFMMKLPKGKVYNIKKRNKIIEDIQKMYGSLGYIYAQIVPVENLDPVKKIADLTMRINEGEVAYVGKLEFKGNSFTKDHVIRREWFLREGNRLNMSALETSLTRMKQLGLVTVEKMPDIKPNPKDPTKVDIIADVKELNRQMINFNVGYSGYDGWFVALGYSTQNFMGMGETLALNLQSGTRAKQYRLAFTEPYLFNLPASLGFSLHKTDVRYPFLYTRKGEGFNLNTSFRFLRYMGASLFYSFENVEMSDINPELNFNSNPYYNAYYGEGKRTISSLSPTVYYSTVDSPIFPSRGTKYLFTYRYSGGFLGGDVNMHKTKFQFVHFHPIGKRHILGMQFVHQAIIKFGDSEIPLYEKFFLGGEQSIRGFDIYRIGPKNEYGNVIGGSKSLFMNLEYQIPLNQQFSFIFFYDIGNAYDFGVPVSLKNVYTSMGLELKIFVPMLNVPFRLIFAYNPRTLQADDSKFVFRFAVGPSFN
jgi:outer membrane protein insertion porin family